MGLRRKSDKAYLRVATLNPAEADVRIEVYASEKIRRKGPGDFDNVLHDSVRCARMEEFMALPPDPTKPTVWANVITAAYLALKTEPPFNGAGDEQWDDVFEKDDDTVEEFTIE